VKITNKRLKEIIAEERQIILSGDIKVNGVQQALKEIAMQSAILHDSEKLIQINEEDLKKIKSIAEHLDSIFYRTTHS
jgi:hypothetical protein